MAKILQQNSSTNSNHTRKYFVWSHSVRYLKRLGSYVLAPLFYLKQCSKQGTGMCDGRKIHFLRKYFINPGFEKYCSIAQIFYELLEIKCSLVGKILQSIGNMYGKKEILWSP